MCTWYCSESDLASDLVMYRSRRAVTTWGIVPINANIMDECFPAVIESTSSPLKESG